MRKQKRQYVYLLRALSLSDDCIYYKKFSNAKDVAGNGYVW